MFTADWLCEQKMPSTELFSYHYHRIWQRLRVGNSKNRNFKIDIMGVLI